MKKSIVHVGYFPITTGDKGVQTYGTISWLESNLAGGREYSAEPTGEASEVYADSVVVYSAEENSGYNIKLTLLDLIDNVAKDWLGLEVNSVSGSIAEYANAGERPRFGLAIVETTTGSKNVITFYYDCQASKRPSEKGKTGEGKFEAQYAEFELAARPRLKDTLVKFRESIPVMTYPTTVSEPTPLPDPPESEVTE